MNGGKKLNHQRERKKRKKKGKGKGEREDEKEENYLCLFRSIIDRCI